MSQRVPASMRTRQSLSDLIAGRLSSPDGRAELVKLATRLIVEETLEAENRDALGRDYYEHGAEPGSGYRNGVRTGRLKTAEGLVEYSAPQIAGRDEPWRSEIREHLKGRTQALEDLAVELLARGLSVRDIEDAFRDETGRLLLSRRRSRRSASGCGPTTGVRRPRPERVRHRLSVRRRHRRAHPSRPAARAGDGGLGLHCDRRRVLLHLMAGSKEDAETVTAFFQDMRARGLGDPLLVVSDGAPGIIKAIEICFPRSARQRCLAHRMRNLAAKVPEDHVARGQGARPGLLPGAEPGDRARPRRRARRRLRAANCRARSPASRTTSRPASPTCDARSPTAARSGPRISSSACSSRSAGA